MQLAVRNTRKEVSERVNHATAFHKNMYSKAHYFALTGFQPWIRGFSWYICLLSYITK